MDQVSGAITAVIGVLVLAAMSYEIRQRRKKLREVYNLLDHEDKALVCELDRMLNNGELQRYQPG